jgi:hypothetical protein
LQTHRQHNVLLNKAQLGKPKKILFNQPGEDMVFGLPGRVGLEVRTQLPPLSSFLSSSQLL